MTTQYGERPGLTVDGDSEYWRGKVAEAERELDRERLRHHATADMGESMVRAIAAERDEAVRERDAARAEADRLRAALERIATETCDHGPGFCPRKFALSILRSTTPNAVASK